MSEQFMLACPMRRGVDASCAYTQGTAPTAAQRTEGTVLVVARSCRLRWCPSPVVCLEPSKDPARDSLDAFDIEHLTRDLGLPSDHCSVSSFCLWRWKQSKCGVHHDLVAQVRDSLLHVEAAPIGHRVRSHGGRGFDTRFGSASHECLDTRRKCETFRGSERFGAKAPTRRTRRHGTETSAVRLRSFAAVHSCSGQRALTRFEIFAFESCKFDGVHKRQTRRNHVAGRLRWR